MTQAEYTMPLSVSSATRQKAFSRPLALFIAVVLCALPFVLSGYQTFTATQLLVYAIAIQGLNLLTGYSGQISFGHSAFYAIGAYTVAILVSHFGLSYAAGLAFAAVLCLVVGFLFGLPALRFEGHYLALATFALAVAVPQLLKFKAFQDWTGGVQGLVLDKPDAPFGLPLNSDQWLYFLTLLIAVVVFLATRNLTRGRIGRALLAIRDQPTAAASMGVDLAFHKTSIFGVSAMLTGLAGGLSAIIIQFVAPDSFSWFLSITFVVGALVGGLGSLSGPFYGALFIQFVPEISDKVFHEAPLMPYGILLIVFMFVLPTGVSGLVETALAWSHKRMRGL